MGCESCKQADVLENRPLQARSAAFDKKENNDKSKEEPSGERKTLNKNLNGKRKSLLIGINYVGQQGELKGSINDVRIMKDYIASCGFPTTPEAMKILTEEEGYESPTKANIIKAFHWLVDGSVSGDNLFLHYSGHGGQLSDKNADESDGKDETLVPLDYQQAGQISDVELYQILVQKLQKGVRLTVIFDCFRPGTAMDLPYSLKANDSNLANIIAIGGSTGSSSMPANATWIAKAIQYYSYLFPSLKPILNQFGNLKGLITGLNQLKAIQPGMGNIADNTMRDLNQNSPSSSVNFGQLAVGFLGGMANAMMANDESEDAALVRGIFGVANNMVNSPKPSQMANNTPNNLSSGIFGVANAMLANDESEDAALVRGFVGVANGLVNSPKSSNRQMANNTPVGGSPKASNKLASGIFGVANAMLANDESDDAQLVKGVLNVANFFVNSPKSSNRSEQIANGILGVAENYEQIAEEAENGNYGQMANGVIDALAEHNSNEDANTAGNSEQMARNIPGAGAMQDMPDLFSVVQQNIPEAGQIVVGEKDRLADVIMLTGCEDKGVFTLPSNGDAGGACTNAMVEILSNNKNLTYEKFLEDMRTKLKQRGSIPQLSSTVNIDINKEPFWLIP